MSKDERHDVTIPVTPGDLEVLVRELREEGVSGDWSGFLGVNEARISLVFILEGGYGE